MKISVLVAALVLLASSAHASLFFHEPFNYPDGNLINGKNGPKAPNPPFWFDGGHLSFGQTQVVSSQMRLRGRPTLPGFFPMLQLCHPSQLWVRGKRGTLASIYW
jgi:hypothetical protein